MPGIAQRLKSNSWLWGSAAWLIFGLIFLKWSPETVIIVFFLESLILGLFTFFHMILITLFSVKNRVEIYETVNKQFNKTITEEEAASSSSVKWMTSTVSAFYMIVFVFIYFAFIAFQSVFVFVLLSNVLEPISSNLEKVVDNYWFIITQKDYFQAFIGVFLFSLFAFLKDVIIAKNYKNEILTKVMTKPWYRLLIQQLVIIIGGYLFFSTGNKLIYVAIVLVLVKATVDSILEYRTSKDSIKK